MENRRFIPTEWDTRGARWRTRDTLIFFSLLGSTGSLICSWHSSSPIQRCLGTRTNCSKTCIFSMVIYWHILMSRFLPIFIPLPRGAAFWAEWWRVRPVFRGQRWARLLRWRWTASFVGCWIRAWGIWGPCWWIYGWRSGTADNIRWIFSCWSWSLCACAEWLISPLALDLRSRESTSKAFVNNPHHRLPSVLTQILKNINFTLRISPKYPSFGQPPKKKIYFFGSTCYCQLVRVYKILL